MTSMKTMRNTLLLFVVLLLVGAPSALGGTFPSSPWFGTNVQNQPDAASARNALGVPTGAHATNADNAGYATNAGHAVVADALAGGINATQVTGLGALAGSNRLAWSSLDNVPGFGTAALVGTNQFVNTNVWYQFTNNALPWASYYLASNPAGYQTAAQVASAAFNSTNGLPIAVWTLGTASQSNAASFDLAGKAVAVTNGYPWGNLYDAAGKAQQATNGLPAGIWTLGNAAAADTNSMKVAASTNADYAATSGYSTNAGGLIDSQNNGRVVISDTTTRIRDANGHSLFVATLGAATSIRGPTNNASQISVDDFGVLIPTMEGNPMFSGNPTIAGGTLNFTNSIGLSGGSIQAESNYQSFSVYDANKAQRINISPNGDPGGLGAMWLNDTNGNTWIQQLTGHGGVGFGDGKGGVASWIDTNGNFSGNAAYATNLLGTINYNQVAGAGTAGQSNAAAFDLAGKATAATNGLPAGVWTMGTASQSNASAFYLSSNPSGFISAVPATYALKTDATNAALTEAQAATNGLLSGAFTAVGSSSVLSSNTLLTEAGALIGGSNYQTAAQVSSASVAYATTAGNLTAINTNNINTNNASQLTSGTVALNLLPSGVVTNNNVAAVVVASSFTAGAQIVAGANNGFGITGKYGLYSPSAGVLQLFNSPSSSTVMGTLGTNWICNGTITATNGFASSPATGSTNDLFTGFSTNGAKLFQVDSNGTITGNGSGLTNVFGTNIISTPLKTTIQNGSPNTLVVTNGNVGIGTTSPSAQLTVASSIVAGTTLTATNGFISYGGYTDTNSGSGNSVQITNGNVTASGTFTGKGGGLTNLNPANLVGLFQNIVVSNTVTWTNNVTSTNWASVSVVSNQVVFKVQGNSIMTVTNIGTVGTPIWRTTVAGNNQSAASYFSSSTGNTSGGLFSNSGNSAQVGFDGNNEPSLYAAYGQMVGYDNNVGATVFYDGSGGGTSIRYNHGGITDSALTNWITGTTVITIGNMATNVAAYTLVSSPTAVASSTSWTNVYGRQIQLIVDGIANMAVAGTGTLLFTNLTTTENHIVAGSTVSIAGATYFSDHETLSPNDIIQYVPTVTGSFTFTFSKTTVK